MQLNEGQKSYSLDCTAWRPLLFLIEWTFKQVFISKVRCTITETALQCRIRLGLSVQQWFSLPSWLDLGMHCFNVTQVAFPLLYISCPFRLTTTQFTTRYYYLNPNLIEPKKKTDIILHKFIYCPFTEYQRKLEESPVSLRVNE